MLQGPLQTQWRTHFKQVPPILYCCSSLSWQDVLFLKYPIISRFTEGPGFSSLLPLIDTKWKGLFRASVRDCSKKKKLYSPLKWAPLLLCSLLVTTDDVTAVNHWPQLSRVIHADRDCWGQWLNHGCDVIVSGRSLKQRWRWSGSGFRCKYSFFIFYNSPDLFGQPLNTILSACSHH